VGDEERVRGANGRFRAGESRNAEQAAEQGGVEERALRPRQCAAYLRKRLAREFRTIVDGFVNEARNGGCAHMKLTAELLEQKKSERTAGKGTAQRLLEELGE
jgi:hypothetical protein